MERSSWSRYGVAPSDGARIINVMAERISIVLALQDPGVRDAVNALLAADLNCEVIGEVASGPQVGPLVARLRPRVLVVDLLLPGSGGLEVTAEVTRKTPDTRVVILSASHEDVFVLEALRNGAAGFVSRDASGTELLQAVREVVAGRHFLSPPLSEAVIEAYLGGKAGGGDAYAALTRREREVLHLVVQGLSTKEIAQRLGISPRTAETHRAHVMYKLGVHSRAELIRFAARRGIVTPGPGQQSA